MEPEFARRTDPHGVSIDDPIENVRFDLYTSEPVAPEPADDDAFYFPVDSVARVYAPEIEIPRLTEVFVRRRDGTLVGETGKDPASSFIVFTRMKKIQLNCSATTGTAPEPPCPPGACYGTCQSMSSVSRR